MTPTQNRIKRAPLLAVLAAACSLTLNVAAQGPPYSTNAPLLPDAALTPGDALPVTARDICAPGYAKRVRNVPQAVKEAAYRAYGITHRAPGEYEVDHLISLELGGSNSLRNLWPQSYRTQPWNAHVKDRLENAYHEDICAGRIDIRVAQQKIAANWVQAFKERFPADPLAKLPTPQAGRTPAGGVTGRQPGVPPPAEQNGGSPPVGSNPIGQVWVNTKSGVYWRPGTRYYGKTKQGKYMSEQDAIKAGYHAAGGQ